MFFLNAQSQFEYRGGKTAWDEAHQIAVTCRFFEEDVEDEQIADEKVSCYNCRYRRWTMHSFVCCKNNRL